MQPSSDFDPARVTRSLLRRRPEGALATLMEGSGDPFCSLVNVATHPDGTPILLISKLALHTRNLLADPRASLMLDERAPGDPLEGARIMLQGRAEQVAAKDQLEVVRRRYLARHPSAQAFVDFADFAFFRIVPSGVHLVAGFGRIIDLAPAQFLTDVAGAEGLVEAEASAVEHMNSDHRDALALYARTLGGDVDRDWRCSSIDPDGLDLQSGQATLRLDFPQPVTTANELRRTLVKLVEAARPAP